MKIEVCTAEENASGYATLLFTAEGLEDWNKLCDLAKTLHLDRSPGTGAVAGVALDQPNRQMEVEVHHHREHQYGYTSEEVQ